MRWTVFKDDRVEMPRPDGGRWWLEWSPRHHHPAVFMGDGGRGCRVPVQWTLAGVDRDALVDELTSLMARRFSSVVVRPAVSHGVDQLIARAAARLGVEEVGP